MLREKMPFAHGAGPSRVYSVLSTIPKHGSTAPLARLVYKNMEPKNTP